MKLSDAKEKYERITTGFLEELIFFSLPDKKMHVKIYLFVKGNLELACAHLATVV